MKAEYKTLELQPRAGMQCIVPTCDGFQQGTITHVSPGNAELIVYTRDCGFWFGWTSEAGLAATADDSILLL